MILGRLLIAAAVGTLSTMGLAGENLHVFQGTNPVLFKDLSDPAVHGYKPDKYLESYKLLYGEKAEERTAAMHDRRESILGRKLVIKAKLLRKLRAREFGQQKAVVKSLSMHRQSNEYKAATRQMRRLTDLSDPENQKLLDQWYKDHRADWFIRGKQFLKPADE